MADEACLHTMIGLMTALDTIPLRASTLGVMLAGQSMSRVEGRTTLAWCLLGRQLFQQLVHELLAEAQLSRMLLPFRPELEGVDDAHIEQPPCKARPRLLALPPYQVGVVQLIAHIDRASTKEVVMHSAGTANRHSGTSTIPTLQ